MSSTIISIGTALTLLVGLVIAVAYLRFMWRALQAAIRTRDQPDSGQDRYARSFLGAIVAVVGSSAAVAAYGWGPALLYLGPILALSSGAAVALCLREEARSTSGGATSAPAAGGIALRGR